MIDGLDIGRARIVVDLDGSMRQPSDSEADVYLTRAHAPPRPWVTVADPQAEQSRLAAAEARQPVAAAMVLRLLRSNETLDATSALERESLVYSTLLGGAEFAHWLSARRPDTPAVAATPLRIERQADALTLWLDDPATMNAMSAATRDALCDALDACLLDPTRPSVTLRSAAKVFSTGGLLAEFGTSRDLALAHLIRTQQSVAARLLRLGHRARAVIEGAAIGSGIEIGAAAQRVTATAAAWFQLPEIAMGLIPGAGGTVTIPRRIGRHRAAWMMLGGRRLSARTALSWGLVDQLA